MNLERRAEFERLLVAALFRLDAWLARDLQLVSRTTSSNAFCTVSPTTS